MTDTDRQAVTMEQWASEELARMSEQEGGVPLTSFRRAKREALIRAIDHGDELIYELDIAIARTIETSKAVEAILAAIRERDLAGAGYTLPSPNDLARSIIEKKELKP